MTVVPNISTLRAMAKAGLIKLHNDTGQKVGHWTGSTITAFYVDGVCKGVQEPFEFKGRKYKLKYFSGCFNPFVVDIDYAKEIGVDLEKTLLA